MARFAASSRTVDILIISVLLVAFGVRAYHLDFQSFWSDEGISLLRSAQPLGELLAAMPTEHMPGYFALLHFWILLAGEQDFGLRFLSLWPSVLAVAVLYRFGADLGLRRAGLVGATLMATGAFQIWYAQEARMYSWLLATGLLSSWLLWRMLTRADDYPRTVFIAYVISTVLCIYTHFYGFLVPFAQTLFALVWLLVYRRWRLFGRWALAGFLVLLCFLPWAPRAMRIFEFSGWREPADPTQIPWLYLTAYSVGDAMPAPWRNWLPWIYLLLGAAGIAAWFRRSRWAAGYLVVLLLVPLTAILLMALRNPDFHERYAIMLSAPLLLLVGAGVSILDIGRRRGFPKGAQRWAAAAPAILVTALLVAANLRAVGRLYNDTSLHKPDFRGAAARIQANERPGDVVLVDGPDPRKVFLHYYSGASPVVDLDFLKDASDAQVDEALVKATEGANHAWELLYFHPPASVQVWLATRAWAAAPSDHNDIRVTRYGLPGVPLQEVELMVPFGSALLLERTEMSAGPLLPGDLLQVSTHWWVTEPPPEYKFSMRLHDGEGNIVLARDYVPQNGFAPTNVWVVNAAATDRRGLLLPSDLAPGTYRLTLRLYNPADGTPQDTVAGQDVELGLLQVE